MTPAVPDWLRGERARPTLAALAGAAGALVMLAGLSIVFEDVPEEDARAFAVALSLFTLLLGCFLMLVERRGALRTAGVGLAAGSVLPLSYVIVNDTTTPPDRTDALITGLVAVVVWLLLFTLSAARGHGLFLGLALLGAWLAAVEQTAPESALFWFEPVLGAEAGVTRTETVEVVPPPTVSIPPISIPPPPTVPRPTFTIPTFPEPEPIPFPEPQPMPVPDFGERQETSLGSPTLVVSAQSDDEEEDDGREPPIAPSVVSMLFGVVYLGAAAVLDRLRLTRLGGAFVAVGVPALAVGVVLLGPRHGLTAVGVAAVGFGLVLLAVGVGGGRRFSGWTGVAVLAGGAVALIADGFEGPGRGDAVAMLVVGAALVAVGRLLSQPVMQPLQPLQPLQQQADQAAHDSTS